MARELRVNIVGDDSSFSRAMRRVRGDADDTSKRLRLFSDSADSAGETFGGLSLRVGAFGGSLGRLAPVLAAATPALVAVGGAATAVAGSLSAAAGGAGALGLGFGASLAPMLVVGKQVTSRFEEVKEAYEAVKTAQKEGTDAAKANAQQALGELSKSERAFVDTLGRVAGLQDKVLGGASDRIFRALSGAIDRLAPVVLALEKPFDRLGDAIADVIRKGSKALSGPEWSGAFRAFVDSATRLVGPMSRIFGSIASIMRDVALAALPLVRDAVKSLADTFGDLDRKATRGTIRKVVGDLVEHTRSWWDLTKEVGKLIFQIFNGGADAGKSLVDELKRVVRRWNEFLGTEEGQREMRRFFRDAVKLTKDLVEILAAVVGGIFKVSDLIIRATNGLQDLERWVGKVDDAMNRWVSGAFRDVRQALSKLPGLILGLIKKLPAKVVDASVTVGKAIGEGILAGAKSALTGSGGGGLGNAILDNLPGLGAARRLGKLVGDGVGKKILPPLPAGGSTGLMGADPDLAPFAAIGARFGLRVSDGLRAPGTRTSSGGISLHSTGDAIDMSGPTSGMMQFARTMASRFGSRLSELIYSPMGFSIKDGKRTAPYAVADHYDHVHLAYEGPFGDGPGRRIFNYFKGKGFTDEQAAAWVGNFVQESRLNPAIVQPGGEGHGLAQWGGSRFTALQAFAKRKGTPWQNMQTQLDFVMFELAGTERAAYSQIKAAGSLEEAVNAIGSAYERFGISGDRLGPARAALERYSGGGASGASGGGGGAAIKKVAMGIAGRGRAGTPASGLGLGASKGGFTVTSLGHEGDLAKVGVRRAKAEARDDLSGLIKVMVDERALKRRRLKAVRRALRTRLSNGRRTRLLEEEATLVSEIGELTASIKEFKADQRGGATTISRAEELEAGVDPNAVTASDFADAALAQAELTPGLGDDLAALQTIESLAAQEYNAAVASGDPRRIADAARNLKSARDAVGSLNETMTQANAIAQQRLALDQELAENQRRILALAGQGPAILAAVVAAVNGGIGGKVGIGFQSTGYAPGTVAAY